VPGYLSYLLRSNWLGVLGAVVALSVVIATAVIATRR